jgi:hypothetical protein
VHSKATNSNKESIKPGTKQKKPYSPPKITTLTAEEAKTELTQKALPGEDATSQLLAAIDRKGSLPGKAKAAPEK